MVDLLAHAGRAGVLLAVAALALPNATSCYLSHERAGAPLEPPACVTPPVASCDAWQAAGEPQRLSGPADPADYVQLGSAVAVDCQVLVSWVVSTDRMGEQTVRHETRLMTSSGEPAAPIEAHPSLTHDSPSWSGLQLAVLGARIGGLSEHDGRCVFVPLGTAGRELGPPVEIGRDVSCRGLDAAGDGFSFVSSSTSGAPPFTLVAIDDAGRLRARTELPILGRRTWWSRTRFADGSFLSYSFAQDLATSTYAGWLQRFDEAGAPLAEEVPLGENGVPVSVSPTAEGALATWMTAASGGQPVRLRPIDRDGRATGPTREVPAEGALYGLAIRSTPDGGALLAWEEHLHESDPDWRVRVQSLRADGTPRGAPTTVMTGTHAEHWDLVVDPSGVRAVLVFGRDARAVDALPLRCAR